MSNIKSIAIDKSKLNKVMKEKGFKTIEESLDYLISSNRIQEVTIEENSVNPIEEIINGIKDNVLKNNELTDMAGELHDSMAIAMAEFMDESQMETEEIVLFQNEFLYMEMADKYGEDIARKMLDESRTFAEKEIGKYYNHAVSILGESDKLVVWDQVAMNALAMSVTALLERKKASVLSKYTEGGKCNCPRCTSGKNEKKVVDELKKVIANGNFDSFDDIMKAVSEVVNK